MLSLQAVHKQVGVDWPTVCSLWTPELEGRGQCWVAFLGSFLKEGHGSPGRTWMGSSRGLSQR